MSLVMGLEDATSSFLARGVNYLPNNRVMRIFRMEMPHGSDGTCSKHTGNNVRPFMKVQSGQISTNKHSPILFVMNDLTRYEWYT